MRTIYLTEKQYIDFILYERQRYGVLTETVLTESKLLNALFRGCTTFSDYARRFIYIASAGIIINTLIFRDAINNLPVGTPEEKQELFSKVEEIVQEKSEDVQEQPAEIAQTNNDTTQYAQSFTISQDGISHIENYEKCYLKPYFATANEKRKGIKTIGWGHKIVASDPDWLKNATEITRKQANALFQQDIHLYEAELMRVIRKLSNPQLKDVSLYPQGFIDAVISMLFNSGYGNLKASKFFQTWNRCRIDPKTNKIRTDDYNYLISMIPKTCVTQNGVVMTGLQNRRNIEYAMSKLK